MDKREREYRQIIVDEGCEIIEEREGKHRVLKVRHIATGAVFMRVMPRSCSDENGLRLFARDIRKEVRKATGG